MFDIIFLKQIIQYLILTNSIQSFFYVVEVARTHNFLIVGQPLHRQFIATGTISIYIASSHVNDNWMELFNHLGLLAYQPFLIRVIDPSSCRIPLPPIKKCYIFSNKYNKKCFIITFPYKGDRSDLLPPSQKCYIFYKKK